MHPGYSIYLAGPWAQREAVQEARRQLMAAGINVNAQWLDVEMKDGAGDTAESQAAAGYDMSAEANRDLADINKSDAMVVLNLEKSEGKAVEQGIALEKGLPIIVVGKRTNVFQYLPKVTVVDNLYDAIGKVYELYERRGYARAA
jgi:nucleoside 2-deoxyribosyltransferase